VALTYRIPQGPVQAFSGTALPLASEEGDRILLKRMVKNSIKRHRYVFIAQYWAVEDTAMNTGLTQNVSNFATVLILELWFMQLDSQLCPTWTA
jgi:hypothetical protein